MKTVTKIMLILGIIVSVIVVIAHIAGLISEEMFFEVFAKGGLAWFIIFLASILINLIAKPTVRGAESLTNDSKKE